MADRSRNPESSSVFGRVRRVARVGAAVGGQAARFAGGRFLGMSLDRGDHAVELRAALGGLKGPLMKVAQIMATIPDLLPEEYAREFVQLQSNAPPMGGGFVRRRMRTELGDRWADRFAEFDEVAAAAASLGQVHKARAHDGTILACKLQYPGMADVVDADLAQLRLALSIYRRYDRSIDTSKVIEELSERLREELDYRREAANARLFESFFVDESDIHVPMVWDDLSSDRLLTMTWVDGAPMLSVRDAGLETRNALARTMFQAWYVPFYRYGVIHGDPHLGNYSVRDGTGINLLDFGCVRVFPPAFVRGVIDLYHALLVGDEELAVHAYECWGFENLDRAVIDILNHWARFLYGPLMEDKVRTIQGERSSTYGAEVAGKVHRALRETGGVAPPREFVLMDRAAIGLGSVFMHLRAELNWFELFHGLADNFDQNELSERQNDTLRRSGVATFLGGGPDVA